MSVVDSVIKRLATLARRVRDPHADLRPAAGVLADAVRLAARGSGSELRSTQPALAALHDSLSGNQNGRSLSTALSDESARDFLVGAVWAISEIYTARLNTLDSIAAEPARRSRRAELESIVLNELRVDLPQTPGEIRKSALDQGVRIAPYEISRTLGELLARNLVRSVEPPESSDRRNRYFILSDEGSVNMRQPSLKPPAAPRRRHNWRTHHQDND